MSNPGAGWRVTLVALALCAASSQATSMSGRIKSVGLPSGRTRPLAMRTANLPATTVIVTNGYALSTMRVSDLNSTVLAGSPLERGYRDAAGLDARFGEIADFALTGDGRVAYVADEANSCIRKVIIPSTGLGSVSTFVGTNVSGDVVGPLRVVLLTTPSSVTLSPDGAYLYIADRSTSRLIKVDVVGGIASYVSMTNWNYVPIALTMGSNPSLLFVSASNNGIFQLDLLNLTATVLDFAAQNSRFLCVTANTSYLFATDATWNAIRVVDLTHGGSRWLCSPKDKPHSGTQQVSDLDTCILGEPYGVTAVSMNSLYISDRARATVTALTYDDYALTTMRSVSPATTTTSPAPAFAPPEVYPTKPLPDISTGFLSFAPASKSTTSLQNAGSGLSPRLVVCVCLGVACLVALALGL